MADIDIRIYAAFSVEPQLFMDLRNANYRYYKTLSSTHASASLVGYRAAYKKLAKRFSFLSSEDPDPLDDVVEMWDDIDRNSENHLWET